MSSYQWWHYGWNNAVNVGLVAVDALYNVLGQFGTAVICPYSWKPCAAGCTDIEKNLVCTSDDVLWL